MSFKSTESKDSTTSLTSPTSPIKEHGLLSWPEVMERKLATKKGGDENSREKDTAVGLQHYVRLSFCPRHPMMYACHHDGRVPNPVILEVDVNAALLPGTLFCDRNATAANARTSTHLEETRLDIVLRDYSTLLDEDKPFYQAEVLIRSRLPPSFILVTRRLQLGRAEEKEA